MDSITDPTVTHVALMKSARIGYTLMVSAAIGYYIHHAPCSILMVQPTVDDAKGFSKETIAPMLRDVPALSAIVFEDAEETGPRDSANTILHKRFPGGVLSLVGANSGAGFRRVSRKVAILDEIDAYPASAGSDGDPVELATKRTDFFWDRKIITGSTPLVDGHSRIAELFEQGDQRRYFVPCPECGHMAPFVFRGSDGHTMTWPKNKPEEAFFACQLNGCVIEHKHKRDMVAAGEWRAGNKDPQPGHVSFHIWAAYSYSPNASWGQLAQEFVRATKGGLETLRVYCNTVLGETFKEQGDAPAWERLYQSRGGHERASVPDGAVILTAGVDVQKDRWVWEVVGWGAGKESWSIDAGVISGDTSREEAWAGLDDILNQAWPSAAGMMTVSMMAVDAGYNTQAVYNWARQRVGRVIAVKGVATATVLIGTPTPVEVNWNGRKIKRGCKLWPIGVSIAKTELYGWLKLPVPSVEKGEPFPNGYCHFPANYEEEFFKQLTAEHLVTTRNKKGYSVREWQQLPNRENHCLDARVYARAAAAQMGVDRLQPRLPPPVADPSAKAPAPAPVAPPPTQAPPRATSGWLAKGGASRGRGKSWLGR